MELIDVDSVLLENKPLTNVELVQTCKRLGIPIRGVFMRDNLPKKPRKDECAIVNLDESLGSGTHWVCYLKKGSKKMYFDSFGLCPPLEVQKYLGKGINYSTYKIQSPEQVICGHLCLHVLNRLKTTPTIDSFEKIVCKLF